MSDCEQCLHWGLHTPDYCHMFRDRPALFGEDCHMFRTEEETLAHCGPQEIYGIVTLDESGRVICLRSDQVELRRFATVDDNFVVTSEFGLSDEELAGFSQCPPGGWVEILRGDSEFEHRDGEWVLGQFHTRSTTIQPATGAAIISLYGAMGSSEFTENAPPEPGDVPDDNVGGGDTGSDS